MSRCACPRIQRGTLLLSSNPQSDFSFGGSVVLIYRHDAQGTEGVIVNQDIGPLQPLLYPNGTDFLNRTGGRPRLRFGGPVNLGSGLQYTQVLCRAANASEVRQPAGDDGEVNVTGSLPTRAREHVWNLDMQSSGPNISHLVDASGVLPVDALGDVNLFLPAASFFGSMQEQIAMEVEPDWSDDEDIGSEEGEQAGLDGGMGAGGVEISHSFSSFSETENSSEARDASMHDAEQASSGGEVRRGDDREEAAAEEGAGLVSFSPYHHQVRLDDGSAMYTHTRAVGGTRGAAGAAREAGGGMETDSHSRQSVEGQNTSLAPHGQVAGSDDGTAERWGGCAVAHRHTRSCAARASGSGEGARELLLHGFAAWCPHQLDREIRAGGWWVVRVQMDGWLDIRARVCARVRSCWYAYRSVLCMDLYENNVVEDDAFQP